MARLVPSHHASRFRVAPRLFIALNATLHQGGAVALYSAMCTIVQTKFLDNECYVSGPPSLSPFQRANLNLAAQKPSCFVVLPVLPEPAVPPLTWETQSNQPTPRCVGAGGGAKRAHRAVPSHASSLRTRTTCVPMRPANHASAVTQADVSLQSCHFAQRLTLSPLPCVGRRDALVRAPGGGALFGQLDNDHHSERARLKPSGATLPCWSYFGGSSGCTCATRQKGWTVLSAEPSPRSVSRSFVCAFLISD